MRQEGEAIRGEVRKLQESDKQNRRVIKELNEVARKATYSPNNNQKQDGR